MNEFPVAVPPPSMVKLIPTQFDGRDEWFLFLRPPTQTDRLDVNLASVARDILNERFHLLSGGQVRVNLNEKEWLDCGSPTSTSTVMDVWSWAFANGMSEVGCEEMGMCDRVRCHPSLTAKRLYFPSAVYHVTTPSMSAADKVKAIQFDLAKWGPCAARMMLYENFFSGWMSTTPYTGPSGKAIGYHHVVLVGWKGDEWICRNTWGAGWGLMGYFTVKMNCGVEMEDHVAAVWPELPWPSLTSLNVFQGTWNTSTIPLYHAVPNALLTQRATLSVDVATGYTAEARSLVQAQPIVLDPQRLPPPDTFWAMDIFHLSTLNVSPTKEEVQVSRVIDHLLLGLILICGAFSVWVASQEIKSVRK